MCILVVEDDSLIRTILVEELVDAGFVVREAESGDRAIELLEQIDVPLTVLVTDIHMPGERSGVDLAAEIRNALPHLPVIYTTGRPDALGPLGRRQLLVRKPYTPAEIISQIRLLLGGDGHGGTPSPRRL